MAGNQAKSLIPASRLSVTSSARERLHLRPEGHSQEQIAALTASSGSVSAKHGPGGFRLDLRFAISRDYAICSDVMRGSSPSSAFQRGLRYASHGRAFYLYVWCRFLRGIHAYTADIRLTKSRVGSLIALFYHTLSVSCRVSRTGDLSFANVRRSDTSLDRIGHFMVARELLGKYEARS